jgi:hypothetical protein
MFAIGADSDNPADGERGGPTLQYLFGRIFTGFGGVDYYIDGPLPTSLYVVYYWVYYLVRILTAFSSPQAANATYSSSINRSGDRHRRRERRERRCDRVHILHQPDVAGVTPWDRPNTRASISLSIFAIILHRPTTNPVQK